MDRVWKLTARMLALAPLMGVVGGPSPAIAPAPHVGMATLPSDEGTSALSVMTYNVEGLPWPVRSGREAAAGRIADRLRGLRSEGRQPHVVVLQEAFGPAQRAIGRRAGYRYVIDGPGAGARNAEADATAAPGDKAYLADAYTLRGEGWGKWAGSGLVLLSDYPVLATARIVFPDYACAGFDCLANKGALVALIAVPGVAQPVAIVATHLNAKDASAVPAARYTYAFRRQIDLLGQFLRATLPAETPFVLAGDTNVGRGPVRSAMLATMMEGLPRDADARPANALSACLDGARACAVDRIADARASHAKGKDLQIWGDGRSVRLHPAAVSVPFGIEPDGSMLSDHIGYSIRYIIDVAPPGATRLARADQ